jgi:phosphoribosylamine--glycine ligase
MKILYVTRDFLAPDLALRMKNEGNDIAIAMKEDEIDVLKGTLKRIPYEKRLDYAKKCDLVVYDDKSEGEAAELRKQGISVIGGGVKTDQIELDRIKANRLAKACGIKVPEIHKIKDLQEAKEFILEKGGKWVLKQMGHLDPIKGLNAVAKLDNSEDVIASIDMLIERWPKGLKQEFCLQEKIEGHEFACGSYWNGKQFQKDSDGDEICEENWEHKPLMSGNMGEATGEQFTVMHYVKAKNSKLFSETIDKIRPLLSKIDFRGDIDINCIVNEKGVYFLEFTPRMGVPATSAQIAIQKTPWGEFLKAMADGKQVANYQYNQGYCIVSWLYTKPFPAMSSKKVQMMAEKYFEGKTDDASIVEMMGYKLSDSYGMPVLFKEKLSDEELDNLHFDAVMMDKGQLRVSNSDGYVLTVTGMGKTVDEAAEKTEELLKKIVIPKGFWRNDFKKSNYHKSRNDLIDWGYLDEEKDEDEMEKLKKQIKEVLKK